MRFFPRRLSTRLILSLTIVVAVVESVSGYFSSQLQEEHLIDAMVLGADQLSRGIASATWQSMLADHRVAVYDIMNTVALKEGIRRIRIFNKEGRIMFSTQVGDSGQVDKHAEACYVCHASEQPLVRVDAPSRARLYTTANGLRNLALITPIYNEPSCSQAECHAHPADRNVLGVLDVALDAQPVEREVSSIRSQFLISTVVGVVLMSLVIFIFTRQFVDKPIRQLVDATRAVSEMRFDQPIRITATTELAELASSFDFMREELNKALVEISAFTDDLERKVSDRTQKLKEANQRLIHTDRMVSMGQLSASVAHEINNPISGVLNFAMLMQRIMSDGAIPPARQKEFQSYLSRIIQETTRVGRIVSDLLAFSRRSKPKIEPSDLNGVIESTLSVIAHKLRLMNVTIETSLDPGLPKVPCDRSQMQQVIINIVMNGAEATHGRPNACVNVVSQLNAEQKFAAIRITDNGEGISPEHVDKVFDPFFTTKEEGKGVGLGLAVVYGIIEAHGGTIEVQSTRGNGTTFSITLPLEARVHRAGQDV